MAEHEAPGTCPICSQSLVDPAGAIPDRDAQDFNCARCGRFQLDGLASLGLPERGRDDPESLAFLSHIVRRMQKGRQPPFLDAQAIDQLFSENEAPTAVDQLQNLIVHLGDQARAPGQQLQLIDAHDRAVIGALSAHNFFWILGQAIDQGYLDGSTHNQGFTGTLSWDGWQLYQQMKEGRVASNRGFMAMPFGNPTLDTVFHDCFMPAVRDVGFRLFRLDHQPRAGSIDDQLRIEIRRSSFLIADLTNGNHGAYWEAGFAEGIGLPVIYSCEEGYFRDPGTHFDTSHMHTVIWNQNSLAEAAAKLRTTLRATFPDEVTFEDDPAAV